MKTYLVNEVYKTIQGEGVRAGTVNIFVRFAYCNMSCAMESGPRSPGGFDCDTEFLSHRKLSIGELAQWIIDTSGDGSSSCRWIVATGGEPGLQLDKEFVDHMHGLGYRIAVETNGSINMDDLKLDWITVSPKVAEHAIRQKLADEVKYVRAYGQGIPVPSCVAEHQLISPAFNGLEVSKKDMAWCVGLVNDNPKWRLSVQQHKMWGVR